MAAPYQSPPTKCSRAIATSMRPSPATTKTAARNASERLLARVTGALWAETDSSIYNAIERKAGCSFDRPGAPCLFYFVRMPAKEDRMTNGIATMADIKAMERIPLADRDLPPSTYEALQRGAACVPTRSPCNSSCTGRLITTPSSTPSTDLIDLVTQTANMFHDLGIRESDVVSMILPNMPQAFFTIWGARSRWHRQSHQPAAGAGGDG